MSHNPPVTINLAVRNGAKFIRHTLNSVKSQTYGNMEINVFDNNSNDETVEIVTTEFPEYKLTRSGENIGIWAAQEKLFDISNGKYIGALTDVILDPYFIENAVSIMEYDDKIGAVQAKIYQMNLYSNNEPEKTNVIDCVGFKIFHSRKIINDGQGEVNNGQFGEVKEIFGVEGAVPIFRKKTLEDCKINGHFIDPIYRVGPLGYGDDLDLAWRMNMFGWKQIYAPNVIAYHDRSTTKGYAKKWLQYFSRRSERSRIDIEKRRLDWRNVRWTIIKNDYIINILKDLPRILLREIQVLGYAVLFEPKVLMAIPGFISGLPTILKTRKEVMRRARRTSREMRKWMN